MRKTLLLAIVWSVSVFGAAGTAHASAELIDRVLAIVNGIVITQSDVSAALVFHLVPAVPTGRDPVRPTLDQLIRRALLLSEVNRYGAIDVDAAAVSRRMATIRMSFGTPADYQAALQRTAMTEQRLKDAVEGDARIDEYVRQRFGAAAEAADDEVATYYEEHRTELTEGGRQMTLEQARPMIRQRLATERRASLIDDWVARLRRRAEVTDLYFAATVAMR